ncbi:hypothetical protein NESM_000394900 [Novymonas esmeraldas]|uniref:Uncharacterized protein n=1 Tax=Novymonas esmeraldas TaxID=1808958 RepID=A0AAW0EN19_9TRYP
MPRNLSDAPSLSVASLSRKAIVMGFGSKLVFGRYPLEGNPTPSPHDCVVVDDGQVVRAVAFLQIPDGPLCIVSAGDGKYINVYNVSSWRQNNPNALRNSSDDEGEGGRANVVADEVRGTVSSGTPPSAVQQEGLSKAEYWQPAFRYGPHTKRITSLATCAEGTVVFADKFGEVYSIRLSWSPSHTIEVDGDATRPATFLLQHFSIISTLHLTDPVPRIEPVAATEERSGLACRRLFTCDKDCHARVSRFPEAYVVEQFLWSRSATQSPVTCVAEIHYMEDAAVYDTSYHDTAARVNKQNKSLNAPYSYYVTGTYAGDVHFWAARNNIPVDSDAETIHLISSFRPQTADGEPEDVGSVVGVVLLSGCLDRLGHRRHPRDCPRGVLIAYERCSDVVFVPLYDNVGTYAMHPAMVSATRTPLEARPTAAVGCNDATAFVLQRSGRVSFLRLCDVDPPSTGEARKTCTFNANIHVEVQELPVRLPHLEERIRSVMGGAAVAEDGAATEAVTELEALDLCASWRYEAVDPRARRHGNDGDDNASNPPSGDDDGGDGDGATAARKDGKGNARKKARVEA